MSCYIFQDRRSLFIPKEILSKDVLLSKTKWCFGCLLSMLHFSKLAARFRARLFPDGVLLVRSDTLT